MEGATAYPARAALVATAIVLSLSLLVAVRADASLGVLEARCEARLARASAKLIKTQLGLNAACRDKRAAGQVLACPGATAEARLSRLASDLVAQARDSCTSYCSTSTDVPCISDLQCPPTTGDAGESCGGGQPNRSFDATNLGYPGPFCEQAVGRQLAAGADLGSCTATLVDDVASRLTDVIYGGPNGPPALSSAAAVCLSTLSSRARFLVVLTLKTASACRRKIHAGKLLSNPARCVDDDEASRARVERAGRKLSAAVASSCTLATVAELPVCGGSEGLTTPAQAAACFISLVKKTVHPDEVPAERMFAAPSLLEAIYPPPPVCGDGVVNQGRSARLPLGEECDGASDSACPGKCMPPGDLFECTCGSRPRLRLFTDASTSQIDSGWTGLGHGQRVADQSGFISGLENCDCALIVDGECVGAATDPVCDVRADVGPRCSWDSVGASTCADAKDCFICDKHSGNRGAACKNDADCESLCYDAQGFPHASCTRQSHCGKNEVCRGRCDRTQTCDVLPNGAPLPVSAGGVAVCAGQTFSTDVTGTRDLLTGAHELYYRQFTKIHLGERTDRPCPVCGGFCAGGPRKLVVCKGRCGLSGDACRFDSDCPVGDRCGSKTPDCPNSHCELSQVCGADDAINPGVLGRPCRIDYEDPVFGTLSNDCPPAASANISGGGLAIDYLPSTSGTVTLPYSLPCTKPGLELYTQCTGDPSHERLACSTNADCGVGVCEDACPGGRCVPLCVPAAAGSQEGICAAGPPVYHCEGAAFSFRQCSQAAATGTCEAQCDLQGTPCTSDGDCGSDDRCIGSCARQRDCEAGADGEMGTSDDVPGAGACVAGLRECFLEPIVASGSADGLTAYDSAALWCFGSMLNSGVNAASGFGGPGRAMVRGINVPNVDFIPAP
jgi:hypothetical protein